MNSALIEEKAPERLFTEEELAQVAGFRLPQHVAIIMDGNRRWAKQGGLPAMAGHWRGAENLTHIVRAARELGIKVLTVYAFSTENWNRPPLEIKALMRLFNTYLLRQKPYLIEEKVRLNVIGDLTKLSKDLRRTVDETVEATQKGDSFDLVIALNYGGRDELRRAIHSIVEDCTQGKVKKEAITEELIGEYLDTAQWKDPDLLIRTSGESRVSNFLLWQISYSEVLVTDVLWPDFCEKDLFRAVLEFQSREMRLGR
ncbi:MAG: Ditrans,polycis-undecaprenyl-diphosphate synthase ((2E,6E)-farnesyl-diphosphate specific) [Chlamydiae bacterium]|nr:Ditrans,polycis-undecaprenyl-diphosphate synthase ((2E,6E)-farnesyl-diphosphate specific) [Chlamydiota bacterium]